MTTDEMKPDDWAQRQARKMLEKYSAAGRVDASFDELCSIVANGLRHAFGAGEVFAEQKAKAPKNGFGRHPSE